VRVSVKQLLVFTPLVAFGLGGIYFLTLFLSLEGEDPVRDSLIPEIIGFCLEGFFLVGLFSLIQRRLERDRKEELRNSLRGALREILSHLDIALLGEYADPAPSKSLEHDPQVVASLILKLNEAEMDVESLRDIKSAAGRTLSTVHDLIPVAAQLSANHMRWWLAIAESVNKLSEATDSSAVNFAAHQFLAALGDFDELSL
jgi:hypothetical protein